MSLSSTLPRPNLVLAALALAGGVLTASAPGWPAKGAVFVGMLAVLVIARFLLDARDARDARPPVLALTSLLTVFGLGACAVAGYRLAVAPPTWALWVVALLAGAGASVLLNAALDLQRELRRQRKEPASTSSIWSTEMWVHTLIALTASVTWGLIIYDSNTTERRMAKALHEASAARNADVVYQPLTAGVRSIATSAHLTLAEIQHLDDALRGQQALRDQARHLLDTQGYITMAQAEQLQAARAEAVKNGLFRNPRH